MTIDLYSLIQTSSPNTLRVGTTTVTSGTNGYILYNNAGALGNLSTTGTGNVVLSASPTLSGTTTGSIFNVPADTGSYNLASVTFAKRENYQDGTHYNNLYDSSGRIAIWLGGQSSDLANYYVNAKHVFQKIDLTPLLEIDTNFAYFTVPLNYGGVTLSNSVTGTGSMVLSASPTLTGTVTLSGNRLSTGVDGSNLFWLKNNAGTEGGNLALAYLTDGAGTVTGVYMATGGTVRFYVDSVGQSVMLGSLVYGGVTLANSVTGTGSMVLASAPTFKSGITIDAPSTTTNALVYISGGSTSGYGGLEVSGASGGYIDLKNTYSSDFDIRIGSSGAAGGYLSVSAGAIEFLNAIKYGGVTLSNSVTGTGSMVLSASPTITGTLTAASLLVYDTANTLGGASGFIYAPNLANGNSVQFYVGKLANTNLTGILQFTSNATTSTNSLDLGIFGISAAMFQIKANSTVAINYALTYGGVTLSNSVTGTGSMVLSDSPTLTGTLTAATVTASGVLTGLSGTAVAAGANTQAFVKASSTANLGLYYGTGDPSFSAAKGSLYVKTDATTTTTRLWINTNGSTTWTNFTSAA